MTDTAISPLRQRMIEDMTVRGFTPGTQRGYIVAVRNFTAFLGRSPDEADAEDLRRYQLHMRSCGASATSMNAAVSALRFFFGVTLQRNDANAGMTTVREPNKLPVVLSPQEVERLLDAAPGLKYRAALSLAYGAGLRASEVVSLKVSDNLMVLNVSTRKYHRAVRLPEGDLAKARGDGTSKSAVSRRFVALSRKKMKAWLASDLSELDLLVIQIDGLHVGDHVLMAAIGVDGNGDKHVLAVVEGATENTVVVQALIDNLLARGLDPTLPRLFIVDGAKALSKAIRNTFGVAAAIQRCQVHKGRNIIERLPQHLHASVKKALRQAWDQDDANKAERLLRNLVRRLEHEEPGVSGSILEGLDEILTVIRLGLPHELRRSLACTNIVENALGTVRQVTRNVKRWRHAEMALRWTAAGLLEAQKTFRRLKAYRQLPILRNALQEHLRKAQADSAIETIMKAA